MQPGRAFKAKNPDFHNIDMAEKTIQKTIPLSNITIYADFRERNSHVIRHLKGHDCNVIEKQLDVADFICSSRVACERKSIDDFLQSIVDQRVFRQLAVLKDSYERPLLILEGYLEGLFCGRHISPNAIRGALAHITVDLGVPVLWTNNAEETAAQLYWIARREQVECKKEISIRSARRPKTLIEKQVYLVSGLPGISNKLARRLLRHFKTPGKVFSVNTEDLKKVENIGEKKARKIRNILDSEYDNGC